MTIPTVRFVFAAALLLATAVAVALHQMDGGTLRFYGAEAEPCVEIELSEADAGVDYGKAEDSPCCLSVTFLTAGRARVAATSSWQFAGSFSVQRPNGNGDGFDLSGQLAVEDSVHVFRATLSADRRELEWIAPETITLGDGRTFRLAGRHMELENEARNAAGKAAFEKIDAELNGIYGEVKEKLGEAAFEQVRESQRGWLTYRDRPHQANYDGDMEQNGPGSATHYRRMSGDTAARIDFLKSFLEDGGGPGPRDGLYSDGLDRTIRVRFVGDEVLTFTLEIQYQNLHVEELFEWYGSITGCAEPEGENVWSATADGIRGGDQEVVIPDRVRFVILPDGTLTVDLPAADDASGQAGALYEGKFRRLRPLTPAEDALRHWLTLLPEEAFEETTDPLTRQDALDLVRTGAGGEGFTIADEGRDHLVLKHHDGEVVLARFPREDGGLILAVEQINGRNLELAFREWDAAAKSFRPWDARLPAPDPEEFFFRPLTAGETSAVAEHCRVVKSLERGDWRGVRIDLEAGMGFESPWPDCHVSVEWDGYRLGGFHKVEKTAGSK